MGLPVPARMDALLLETPISHSAVELPSQCYRCINPTYFGPGVKKYLEGQGGLIRRLVRGRSTVTIRLTWAIKLVTQFS